MPFAAAQSDFSLGLLFLLALPWAREWAFLGDRIL